MSLGIASGNAVPYSKISIRKYTMSLLDKIDILITPNAYKKGKLFAALPSPTFGGELAVDGDFADGSTAWTLNPGWSIGGNSARYDGNALGTSIAQNISGVTGGNRYTVTFEVTQNTGDQNNTVSLGSTTLTNSTHLPLGCNTFTGVAGFGTALNIYGNSGEILIIRNLTVKQELTGIADLDFTRATAGTRVDENGLVNYAEVLGSELVTNGDFTQLPLGTGWDAYTTGSSTVAFTEGAILSIDGSNSNVGVYQQNIFTNGVQYKIVVSVKATASFDAEIVESQGAATQTTIGTVSLTTSYQDFVFYFTGTGTNDLFIHRLYGETAGQNQQIYIKEVSVKEVTRDNVPRIDYTGGGCPHILAEPQRTNELTQSNQFDTTWVQSGTLTSGQDGVGGSTDAWKFENPNATSSLYQTDTTSGVQTMSAYFKKNSNYGVRFFAFGSVNCSTYFNLNNGTVVLSINSTAKVESAGADWFRCSMTFDQTTSSCSFYVTNNNLTQVLGNITLQYAQLEVGSYATSYIPTEGTIATRAQETYKSAEDISGLINSDEGVLFVEMAALSNDSTRRTISLSNGTNTNRVVLRYDNANNRVQGFIQVGGATNGNINDNSYTITNFLKIAYKWKAGDFALWINGTEVAVSADATSFGAGVLTQMQFNEGDGAGKEYFGKVKQLQVYDTVLTDEELTLLTIEPNSTYSTYAEMANALNYTLQ